MSRTYSISCSGLLTLSGKHPQNHWLVHLHEHWLFRGRQMGEASWQKNIHCKQGLQRSTKESSLGVNRCLANSSHREGKKKDIWRRCCLWLCGFNPPPIRISNEPRACTCRSFASSAVHGWSHIEHRWELGINLIYPFRDHQSNFVRLKQCCSKRLIFSWVIHFREVSSLNGFLL